VKLELHVIIRTFYCNPFEKLDVKHQIKEGKIKNVIAIILFDDSSAKRKNDP
jgi:hypothetical protein